jgi:molybdopterin/thiamine biosynthesis adenylyltransferase
LGGQVILLLARIGIGHLIIVDHDVFDETNLNRQPLCSKETLGKSKSLIAADIVASINPGVEVTPYQMSITPSNIDDILIGTHITVDALDNVHDRLLLQAATERLGIPLIHGAVAGFGGRIMTIYPGDQGLRQLYGSEVKDWDDIGNAENFVGIPVITPTIIASLQAMEVLKVLLKRGKVFRNVMAYFELESSELDKFTF